MPDTSKLEKLNRELEKSEKKLRKAINDEKALQHQLKQLTRKERTHRLCTRGGMLESFLQEPERLTDDDVMLLLKLIFHRQDTQELLKKCWNGRSRKPLSLLRAHYPRFPIIRGNSQSCRYERLSKKLSRIIIYEKSNCHFKNYQRQRCDLPNYLG